MIGTLLLALTMATPENAPPENVLTNGDFTQGLASWRGEGSARVEAGAVHLGPGKGAVTRRYSVPGLRILWFGATMTPSAPGVTGDVRLRCYDAKDRLLMDLSAPASTDPKQAVPAIYAKTQARTAYVTLSLEKTGEGGELVADDAILRDDDRKRVERKPMVDLDAATRPFWQGQRVEDETVLLLSKVGGAASGRLLFRPRRIVSVRAEGKLLQAGRDYTLYGSTLTAVAGSAIPTLSEAEFAKGEFPWTDLRGRHVAVTYEHDDAWTGPVPDDQRARLTRTVARLRARRPLRVVAYGDSITHGMNVSGLRGVPPYLPPWPALFGHALERAYGGEVEVANAALPGAGSYWAIENARDAVGALEPDLVLLAFGMNDFWSLTPELFRKNIEATMAAIRARSPGTEFLLVAPMRFDPVYTDDATYTGNLAGYADELARLTGPGVGLLDMTAMTDALYAAKGAKSLTTDPMHPDDFLARVYAQGAAATLVAPPPLPKGFLVGGDPSEIPEVEASGAEWTFGGKATDPFLAMRAAGWNLVRFRVWNDPALGRSDRAHTLALARRAKAAGLAISIDLHYSDGWADPAHQTKPAAWKDLPFEGLTRAVHDYTKDVIGALRAQGTPPVMVQIGNEITPGMLWPDGRNDTPEGWTRLAKLIAAGMRAVHEVDPAIKTMIHLDRGGDNAGCRWFFDNLKSEGVDFDLIGLSYYPWWHGPLGALRENLNDLAARYGKDVYVVETAYPYTIASGNGPTLFDGRKTEPGFPATPEGQASFVRSVIDAVRDVPGGRGKGVLYWAPLWTGKPGRQGGYRNLTVFDPEGRALPAFATLGGH